MYNHIKTKRRLKHLTSFNRPTVRYFSVFIYPSIAACAAANLAIGTRNGEPLT